jgi:hypothetical protein
MGSRGTTSNRDGADSIQIFSDDGEYNNKSYSYKAPVDQDSGLKSDKSGLVGMRPEEIAYEPPRYNAKATAENPGFDYGPCGFVKHDQPPCELAEALVGWPSFDSLDLSAVSHDSLGYAGTYRGRAKDAQIFVLADQTSHDDMFSGRALTGAGGQLLQSFLQSTGVGSRYFVLRTLPRDTLGLSAGKVVQAALDSDQLSQYKKIIKAAQKQGNFKVFVAYGPVATAAMAALEDFTADDLKVNLDLKFNAKDWNQAAKQVATHLKTSFTPLTGALTTIPREDLPYHSRWWMGSSGDRAARREGPDVGNYYQVWAPKWVTNLRPVALTAKEKAEIRKSLLENKDKVGVDIEPENQVD